MATEVLVMCSSCARPQPQGAACVHCGAALPDAPHPPAGPHGATPTATPTSTSNSTSSRTSPHMPRSVLSAPADVELSLGADSRLFVTQDALELRGAGAVGRGQRAALIDRAGPGSHPNAATVTATTGSTTGTADAPADRVMLADVRQVRLEKTRPWPLLAAVWAPALVGLALTESWPLRVVLIVVALMVSVLVLRMKTLYLRIDQVNAEPRRIRLGGGPKGSAPGVDARSRWVEVSEELRRRGVDVQG